jgi:hypothetical protein
MLALCVPAKAQVTGPAEPPTRGLFGGGGAANAKQVLNLGLTVVEGYDSDKARVVPASASTPSTPSPAEPVTVFGGGFSTMLRTGAVYTRRGKAEIGARANSVLRYYSDPGTLESIGHNAGIGLTAASRGGLTLLANQSAAYSPATLYGLFPEGGPPEPGYPGISAPNYTVSNFQSYAYTSVVTLGHSIGSRNSVSATGEYVYTDRVHETLEWGDVSSYSVSGQFSRKTTRHTTTSTELRYRSGEFAYRGGGKTTELALDAGVNYTRPVSASRHSTVDVHMGVSRGDYPGNTIGLTGIQRRYRVVGDGGFSLSLSQIWQATATVRRGLEYESSFPTPVVNNGAKAALTGFLTNRIDVSVSGGFSRAESILNSETLSIDSYNGEVGVRYAVNRTLALTGGYLYYYYLTDNGTLLLPGMPPSLRRNGVRVGFTLWAPALRR